MGERMTTQFEIRSVKVILPTFNERNNIEQMIGEVSVFAAENPHYHFLFVDDVIGSRRLYSGKDITGKYYG
jgi:hypothetical protein